MHAIDELAAKAVPEEPKPATSAPSTEVTVLPPPPTRRITRSQSKVRRSATECAYPHRAPEEVRASDAGMACCWDTIPGAGTGFC